jgi:hypothetical protein
MASRASVLAGFTIALWAQLSAGQTTVDPWSLEGLQVQSVPAIWIDNGSEFVRESSSASDGYLQLRGRLQVRAGALLDPIAIAEIRLRTADSAAKAKVLSAFAVGASIVMCRYLPRDPQGWGGARMVVGGERSIALSRASVAAPLKLSVEGASVNLCIAFARSAKVGEVLLLEFGGRSFTVQLTDTPNTPVTAEGNIATPSAPFTWPIPSRRTVWIAAASLLALGLGVFASWRWRVRRQRLAAIDPRFLPRNGVSGPRRVSAEHCRTSFVPVGANTGPGKADFAAALREIQGERFSEADALLAQAISKGLPATFECGAWSLRGQAAIALGDIDAAIDCFLKTLEGPAVTTQAALPAVMHLAVIYRALGMRSDAKRMEALAKTLAEALKGLDLELVLAPEMVKRIRNDARAYRQTLRLSAWSRLGMLLTGEFKRSP